MPALEPTYILSSNDLIGETQHGFAWPDAVERLWTGDYDGTPHLHLVDFAAGTVTDSLNKALIELADRAHVEDETPKHLRPLFDRAGLDVPADKRERPYRRPQPDLGFGPVVWR